MSEQESTSRRVSQPELEVIKVTMSPPQPKRRQISESSSKMSVSSPESKRRRVSTDDSVQQALALAQFTGGCAKPALVHSSSPASSTSTSNTNEVLDLTLKEIPKLFFMLPRDNINDVWSAVHRLRMLFKREESPEHFEDNRKEAIDLGITGLLVLVLRKWKCQGGLKGQSGLKAQDILSKTLACLGSLAKDDAVSIVKLGGLDLIVTALKSFPLHVSLQCNGLLALCKILSVDPRAPLPIRQGTDRFVTQMDGIEMVVMSMNKFPGKTNLLHNGCFVLDIIAQVRTHHELLHTSGATSLAAAAMGNRFVDAIVKKRACVFLSRMMNK